VVLNRLAAIRRSRHCTRSNEDWDEETVDPSELRLARVTEPIIPDSLAVVAAAAAAVAVAVAARSEDCSTARTACRSW